MGISKSHQFNDYQNEIASLCKALAHPARIAIIEYLAKIEGCICGDIVEEIGLAQSTISQHLKELKKANIIKGNIEGAKVCYCIDVENWNKMKDIFEGFLHQEVYKIKSCC